MFSQISQKEVKMFYGSKENAYINLYKTYKSSTVPSIPDLLNNELVLSPGDSWAIAVIKVNDS